MSYTDTTTNMIKQINYLTLIKVRCFSFSLWRSDHASILIKNWEGVVKFLKMKHTETQSPFSFL